MRILNEQEIYQVNVSGWFKFVFPVILGFVAGGPLFFAFLEAEKISKKSIEIFQVR